MSIPPKLTQPVNISQETVYCHHGQTAAQKAKTHPTLSLADDARDLIFVYEMLYTRKALDYRPFPNTKVTAGSPAQFDTLIRTPDTSGSLTTCGNLFQVAADDPLCQISKTTTHKYNINKTTNMNNTLRAISLSLLVLAGAALTSCETPEESGDISVERVSVAPSVVNLLVGESEKIAVTVEPFNATDRSVTFSSGDETIATVDNEGTITAVAAGETVITVTTTDGGLTAECSVTVSNNTKPIIGIDLSPKSLTMELGEESQLTVIILPEDATDKTIEWTSENAGIASVDNEGKVTAVAEGETKIVASAAEGKFTATCDVKVINTKKYPFEVVLIPAGTFIMGSPEDQPNRDADEPQHEVTISKNFYMGKYEVTNEQYAEFLNDIGVPYNGIFETQNDGQQMLVHDDEWGVQWDNVKWIPTPGRENCPVIAVTWYGADEYAKWAGGSLPTEAQWEYACLGGEEGGLPFAIGEGTKITPDMANYKWQISYDIEKGGEYFDDQAPLYPNKPVDVGSYAFSNGYGLFDMHGNVCEWCTDWMGDYPTGPVTDPTGPSKPNNLRSKIIRGGCFLSTPKFLRTASRDHMYVTGLDMIIGFRVVFEQ